MELPIVVDYHNSQKVQTAIVTLRGRKYLTLIMIDDQGIIKRQVPHSEERHMKPLLRKGKPYPVKTAARLYEKTGKARGISKGAKAELKKVR